MKKKLLFKGVAVLGAVLLLTNTALPGLQAFADDDEIEYLSKGCSSIYKLENWDKETQVKVALFNTSDNVCYKSITDAITNANSGDTIKFLGTINITKDETDIQNEEDVMDQLITNPITINKNLTLDLDGRVLQNSAYDGAFVIEENTTLNITSSFNEGPASYDDLYGGFGFIAKGALNFSNISIDSSYDESEYEGKLFKIDGGSISFSSNVENTEKVLSGDNEIPSGYYVSENEDGTKNISKQEQITDITISGIIAPVEGETPNTENIILKANNDENILDNEVDKIWYIYEPESDNNTEVGWGNINSMITPLDGNDIVYEKGKKYVLETYLVLNENYDGKYIYSNDSTIKSDNGKIYFPDDITFGGESIYIMFNVIEKYTISLNQPSNGGTIKADLEKAKEGDTVTLTATPASNYNFTSWTVKDADNNDITVTDDKFIMPAGNVEVSATFTAIDYIVTVTTPTNGTVTADKTSGLHIGDEVKLTVTPASGYKLDKLTVKNGETDVTVTDNKFTMPAGNVEITATFTKSSSSSGGSSSGGSSSGGGGSSRSSTTKTTTTTTGDAKTTIDTSKTDDNTKTDESKADEAKISEEARAAADAQALKDGYSQEFIDAYNFARKYNITTKDTIREADMDAPLTRIAMAKMLSQYAINVLGKTPDTSVVVPTFPDVDAKLDADYNNGVTLAYQLGIMGINVNKYRPFDLVTRAEFGTALSRMLYGLSDGEGDQWYKTHLDKLMEEQIITNNNPNLQELRGYVMIMLMRSAQ